MTALTGGYYVGVAGRNEFFDLGNPSAAHVADAKDGFDTIFGFHQPDLLYGGLGRDFILAYAGNDAIFGDQSWNDETVNVNQSLAAEADVIFAMEGDDTVFGGGGNNFIHGGPGNDSITGGSGNEMLGGGTGDDTISGGGGEDRLYGGTGTQAANELFLDSNIGDFTTNFDGVTDQPSTRNWDITAYGNDDLVPNNTGADYLDGGAGNDQLDGQDGADTMVGGTGDDTFYVDTLADKVFERSGEGTADKVIARSSYWLAAGQQVEIMQTVVPAGTENYLRGNELGQRLNGNNGANSLLGEGGVDVLDGLGGIDWLDGGTGHDTIAGGAQADRFVFRQAGLNAANSDLILDFASDDFIWFDTPTGPPGGVAINPNTFVNGTAALGPEDRFIYHQATGQLSFDSDGTGGIGQILFATLGQTTHFALTAADIILF